MANACQRDSLERMIINLIARMAQEVEMAVTLLYECGEGATEEMSKPGCGMLGQLAAGTSP